MGKKKQNKNKTCSSTAMEIKGLEHGRDIGKGKR